VALEADESSQSSVESAQNIAVKHEKLLACISSNDKIAKTIAENG
jgi:hypothetical protein